MSYSAFARALRRVAGVVWLTGAAFCGAAQTTPARTFVPNHNLWLVFNTEPRLSERWGFRTELIYRRASWARALQQVQLRVAPVWNPRPDLQLSIGYLFSRNYRYGDYPVLRTFNEHRLYEQVLLRSTFGRFALAHRYRLEQRWTRPAVPADPTRFATVYLNRTRYMARLTRPLSRPEANGLGLYGAVSGEAFVGFGRNVANNIFEQGRAYAGLGWQFSAATALEAGYLHQLLAQGNGRIFERNHTLLVALNFNPNWGKHGLTRPETNDSSD